MLKTNLMTVLTMLLVMVMSTSGITQTVTPSQQQQNGEEITDADLKKYVKVSRAMEKMQQSSQQEMTKIVEDQGMEVQRYSEIARSQQSGNEIEMTDKEKGQFEAIQTKLQEYNADYQKKVQGVMETNDMDQQKFMQIRQQLSQSQELQNRLKEIENQ